MTNIINSLWDFITGTNKQGAGGVPSVTPYDYNNLYNALYALYNNDDAIVPDDTTRRLRTKGCVIFPPPSEETPWMMDWEAELFNFPNSAYKDQVDAFSQLCDYLSYYLAEGLQARTTGRTITQ